MFRTVSARPLTLAWFEVHAALLQSVRREHERVHGRVESSGELLQLVAFDPAFAWLVPLTQVLDALQEGQQGAEAQLSALIADDAPFRAQLLERVQREPEVAWAYAQAQRHAVKLAPPRAQAS